MLALVGAFLVDGLLGEAAQRVWLGKVPAATAIAAAAGGIAVQPGDTTVRRNQDLGISALVAHGGSDVTVYVKFEGGEDWEAAPMEADGKGGYAFTLFAVRDAAQYYVTSGSLRSKEHRIQVVDLPKIEKLRLTYEYPSWTGLPRRTGRIRWRYPRRRPARAWRLKSSPTSRWMVRCWSSMAANPGLSQTGATSRGDIAVKKAGHYRIATRFGKEIVPLTPDYVIDLVIDERPTIEDRQAGQGLPGHQHRGSAGQCAGHRRLPAGVAGTAVLGEWR